MENHQNIAQKPNEHPKLNIGQLELTLLSVSSSRFTYIDIDSESILKVKYCKDIRKRFKKLSDIQQDMIFNCCCMIDNNSENENCSVSQLLKDTKEFWISNQWDQQTSLFGDSWTDMFIFFDLYDIINLAELFNHFECTEQWIFIRGQDTQTKSYNNDTSFIKPTVSRKRKRINYETFQNSIQLVFCPNEGISKYDIKIFANGKYNISGCKTDSMDAITAISQQLINKINNTKYAVTMSKFATRIYPTFEKLPAYFEHVKITLFNGVSKTNLTLKPTSTNQFGLKDIFDIFQNKYKNLLVQNTHPKLQSKQVPLLLPPPELRQGRRLLIKLNIADTDLVTVQLHTTGTLVFSAGSKESMILAYKIMGNVLSDYQVLS